MDDTGQSVDKSNWYVNGRFAPGNKYGKGNPHGKKLQALRAELYGAVTREDMREIVAKLIALAKGGDLVAIKELFDRLLGKAVQAVDLAVDSAVHGDMAAAREELLNDRNYIEYLRVQSLAANGYTSPVGGVAEPGELGHCPAPDNSRQSTNGDGNGRH